MLHKEFRYSIYILLILLCFSCKKYLDKKSDKALVSPSSLNDLQGILDDNGIMNLATPAFGEASCDDYFLLASTYNARPDRQKNVYIWVPDDYYFQNDWSETYLAVYNTNLCLEAIEKIKKTTYNELHWNNVRGSALFFRAYCYLNLMWVYAKAWDESSYTNDLGVVLRLSSDFNISSARSNVKDCYNQILDDVNQAVALLPAHPSNQLRPSKAAAYGLLARIYLSTRNYDSAGKYADLCLTIKNDLLDYNNLPVGNSVPFSPFNEEIIFYSQMSNSLTLHNPSRGKVDTLLYQGYNDNDLRKKAFFSASGQYHVFKGSYIADPYSLFTGIATDEMYLIRAECYARAGKKDEAMNDLNTLLAKRWLAGTFTPITASNAQEALKIILEERRKELVLRGLRWPDIKRLNKENANIVLKRIIESITYELPPGDDRFALPLPADIIELTGIQQN